MRFDGDIEDVLQRACSAGVSRMTVIGTRAADSEAAVQLSENEEGVFCAVGIHPNDVDDVEEAEWGRIQKLAESGKFLQLVKPAWTGFAPLHQKKISNCFLTGILPWPKQRNFH